MGLNNRQIMISEHIILPILSMCSPTTKQQAQIFEILQRTHHVDIIYYYLFLVFSFSQENEELTWKSQASNPDLVYWMTALISEPLTIKTIPSLRK